ncbi:MAG: hypothetical protein NPIRA04_08990 [Nitrospirales bacterium]|nr:MAG: hypothetical protein NPIRA04_08990 [Nitrospirales bacterium]
MLFQSLADLVLVFHLWFILFVLMGGLLILRWNWVWWVHLPAVLWVVMLEFGGWICPLTPLENWLRHSGGEAGFSGGFIEHYLVPVIYPEGLTPSVQWCLGVFVVLLNLGLYSFVYSRRAKIM